ncbi:MAG: HAD-IC family P-type ATPase, partial [Anaerolineae bacterium]|nr:HAD-IC family P-type ATPase [Anaerolineae bacterium]
MLPTSHGSMVTTLRRIEDAGAITGLSDMEVRTARERGDGNDYQPPTSRSLVDILRQNVFTLINIVLFTLGAVMVSIGRVDEALTSVWLITMNILFGVVQEIRAKRKLDQIALLTRPKVSVIRESEEREIDPAEIVRGDIVVLRAGDQVVVDGIIVGEGRVEVDESLITGESDAIPKCKGDHVLSGSLVLTGFALFVVRRVGAKSFANTISAEARNFSLARTPLQRDVDLVIRISMMIALFFGLLLGFSALLSDIPLMRSVQMATVFAGLVPNGLFFMVIVAYAMGAVRIMNRGALVQQANSVESLSNVNVLCMDKTGTLTANRINFHDLLPLADLLPLNGQRDDLERVLGDFAQSATAKNRTNEALIAAFGGTERRILDEVPFSSARKWSAVTFSDSGLSGNAVNGVYVLGAPEMLEPYLVGNDVGATRRVSQGEAASRPYDTMAFYEQATTWTDQGLRVLLFAYNREVVYLHGVNSDEPLLPELTPLALIAF